MQPVPLSQDFETLKIGREGKILIVSFNRPECLNAINGQMHYELSVVFEQIGRDTESDVVILTGEGSSFCAGGDMHWIKGMGAKGNRQADALIHEGKKIITDLLDISQPVIAAIRGFSAGLGSSIALNCDMIIAEQSAQIADPHVRVGLVAGDGGAAIWPLLCGVAKAKEYLMTGDFVKAAEAERIGLINRVVPDGTALDEARAYAKKLLRGSQPAIRGTKRSVNQLVRMINAVVFEYSLKVEQATLASYDVQEGANAILEKRRPEFRD